MTKMVDGEVFVESLEHAKELLQIWENRLSKKKKLRRLLVSDIFMTPVPLIVWSEFFLNTNRTNQTLIASVILTFILKLFVWRKYWKNGGEIVLQRTAYRGFKIGRWFGLQIPIIRNITGLIIAGVALVLVIIYPWFTYQSWNKYHIFSAKVFQKYIEQEEARWYARHRKICEIREVLLSIHRISDEEYETLTDDEIAKIYTNDTGKEI